MWFNRDKVTGCMLKGYELIFHECMNHVENNLRKKGMAGDEIIRITRPYIYFLGEFNDLIDVLLGRDKIKEKYRRLQKKYFDKLNGGK